MSCASCEVLLEKQLRTIAGVEDVAINHHTGVAHITSRGKKPSRASITKIVTNAGYSIADGNAPSISNVSSTARTWMEIGAALLMVYAIYSLLHAFHLTTFTPSLSNQLSVGGIFLFGLIAGTSSCLAVAGGLLLALAAKYTAIHTTETPMQKFMPLLHFNIGRLISYFILGGCIGALGKSITLSVRMSGYMNILIALVMFYMGLSILEIIPKNSFPIRPPKKLSLWIMGLSESEHPIAPFLLGALTFFLPCGFTQSLQFAALASGSFSTGAMILFIFALGTLPSLIGISIISSTVQGTFFRLFLRFSGVAVLVLALFNFHNGLALAGFPVRDTFSANDSYSILPPIIDGAQEISMRVTPEGYEPQHLTIKAGIPVRWNIDGTDAAGCTTIMTIPSLNYSHPLLPGANVLEFTAPEPGQLAFMCSIGAVRGSFTVL